MQKYNAPIFFAFAALIVSASNCTFAQQSLELSLRDGSKLLAQYPHDSIAVTLESLDLNCDVPFSLMSSIEPIVGGVFVVTLKNKDRMTVRFAQEKLKVESSIGEASVPVEMISAIKLLETKQRPMAGQAAAPANHAAVNQIRYAGLNWQLWRTRWAIQDNRLTAIGQARPGFRYGHWASGRGGQLMTGNADTNWQDYEFSFDFAMVPATKDFFHAHIPGETRGMAVFFRCKSMTESWNEPDTCYMLGIAPDGSWGLGAYEGLHCPGFGWNDNLAGKQQNFTGGKMDTPLNEEANHLRVQVHGNTMSVWINDKQVTEFTHEEGGDIEPIPFGGFGVRWKFESLGWIENVVVKHQ